MDKNEFPRINAAWLKIAMLITENPPRKSMDVPEAVCPECGAETILFSFSLRSQPSLIESLYLTCQTCRGLERYTHYALSGRPQGFAEHLIHPYYQRIEDWVRRNSRL